jgi:hypothetical protein
MWNIGKVAAPNDKLVPVSNIDFGNWTTKLMPTKYQHDIWSIYIRVTYVPSKIVAFQKYIVGGSDNTSIIRIMEPQIIQ